MDKIINTTGDSNLHFVPLKPYVWARLDIAWKKYQTFTKAAEVFLKGISSACAE